MGLVDLSKERTGFEGFQEAEKSRHSKKEQRWEDGIGCIQRERFDYRGFAYQNNGR